jgi:hypothetical protein
MGSYQWKKVQRPYFKMKLNKSPGLTVEFHRTIWESIKYLTFLIINKCYEDKQLCFQRTSVQTLLFKKDDPLKLDNNRPISLLNVDLNLLSYTLTQHMKKMVPKLVNEDQTGYI